MTNNEILIGRDNSCHIRINPECRYCSGIHGALYMSGNTLMYRDQSRNGTTINNNMVRQQTVPIKYGDTIMLAGQYCLDWNIICSYFPQAQQMPAHTIIKPQDNPQYQQEYRPEYRPEEKRTPNLHKFNWGAFFLYPIWGLFNGCWWALLLFIFCCWASILLNLMFGIFGTRLAWQNCKWESVEDFEQTQHTWALWGAGLFFSGLIIVLILAASLGSVLSSMF